MTLLKKISFIVLSCVLIHATAVSQPLRIAVAANAASVIKLLQADFKKRTGIQTETILGASGKLTTQIEHGAPFDLFLSADMDFPERLSKAGLTLTKPHVYAQGSLIICSTSAKVLKEWQKLLSQGATGKIAIANPKLAPYGKAAEEALSYYKLMDVVKPNLVYGESISQVNTYLTSGAVAMGFTTEAFLYEQAGGAKLTWTRIDSKSYEKIEQGMVVLNYAKNKNYAEAMKFYTYLLSAPAKSILRKNGYFTP
ncbi:MAG: molybdate ABC transporter substrate-binding protein [Pedobacter sp.]|nr:MAG: molybdate ABC transporter substrate-binding protein [Pedobacter sp.]